MVEHGCCIEIQSHEVVILFFSSEQLCKCISWRKKTWKKVFFFFVSSLRFFFSIKSFRHKSLSIAMSRDDTSLSWDFKLTFRKECCWCCCFFFSILKAAHIAVRGKLSGFYEFFNSIHRHSLHGYDKEIISYCTVKTLLLYLNVIEDVFICVIQNEI